MAVQTVVNNQDNKEYPFPKVMIAKDSGRIVFFLRPEVGVQLNNIEFSIEVLNCEPHYSEDWEMSNFVDLAKSLTLINTF